MFDRHNVGTWPATVNLEFVNREAELKDLDAVAAKGVSLSTAGVASARHVAGGVAETPGRLVQPSHAMPASA